MKTKKVISICLLACLVEINSRYKCHRKLRKRLEDYLLKCLFIANVVIIFATNVNNSRFPLALRGARRGLVVQRSTDVQLVWDRSPSVIRYVLGLSLTN